MERLARAVGAIEHFAHRHFLGLLLATYAVAALWPAPGLAIARLGLGEVALFGSTTRLSLPMLMLGFLLFNAGLGVQADRLKALWKSPGVPAIGLVANLLVPILYIWAVSLVMRLWHNNEEVQSILVGLALIASMPIAGSSTAWSQNANGDLAMSLGLVLGSTLLSPFTTPLALHAVGLMASGDYAEDLHELATSGAGGFLALSVILPSLLGIVARRVAGEARVAAARPRLKLANTAILLGLNLSNASLSLPKAIAAPDWDFLLAILAVTVGLCALGFGAGWGLARLLGVDPGRRTSLMFGLGMNNNGTGLVLASISLADHPRVMVPILAYNLVQHLVAGFVDRAVRRPAREAGAEGATRWSRPTGSSRTSRPRSSSTSSPVRP